MQMQQFNPQGWGKDALAEGFEAVAYLHKPRPPPSLTMAPVQEGWRLPSASTTTLPRHAQKTNA
jgi:hypothetical protein